MVPSTQEARGVAATIPHVGEGELIDAQGSMALKAALETEGNKLPGIVIGTVEQELALLTESGEIPRCNKSNVLSDAQLEAFAKRFALLGSAATVGAIDRTTREINALEQALNEQGA